MKILLTGGTGFVGSHTAAALASDGHQVRLLVRKPERVPPALDPFGLKDVEVFAGDVTDRRSVEKAADGCDATIHSGSVYSLDPRMNDVIRRTNVAGTKNVIEAACSKGHDPIVHVSSFVALLNQKCAVLSPASEPGTPQGAYFRSKADSDRIARDFQKENYPVVITYPGSVWGPNDPHLGESCQMAQSILKGLWAVTPKGIVSITDVRDLAGLHARIMQKNQGPRRYIAPAHNIDLKSAFKIISTVTGRKLSTVSMPGSMLLGPLKALDYLQGYLPFRFPINFQAAYCASLACLMDDSKTRSDLGIIPRPLEQTFSDTLRWMVEAGHLSKTLVGKLAS